MRLFQVMTLHPYVRIDIRTYGWVDGFHTISTCYMNNSSSNNNLTPNISTFQNK